MSASYFGILPAAVRYDDMLPSGAKLLYADISALCRFHGLCRAPNSYFARRFQVSISTVSRWIARLLERGYVTADFERGFRRLGLDLSFMPESKAPLSSPPEKVAREAAKSPKESPAAGTKPSATPQKESPAADGEKTAVSSGKNGAFRSEAPFAKTHRPPKQKCEAPLRKNAQQDKNIYIYHDFLKKKNTVLNMADLEALFRMPLTDVDRDAEKRAVTFLKNGRFKDAPMKGKNT